MSQHSVIELSEAARKGTDPNVFWEQSLQTLEYCGVAGIGYMAIPFSLDVSNQRYSEVGFLGIPIQKNGKICRTAIPT